MKSEKEQMTESRERSIVEIQFRDIQRDQENVTASPKVKEEKKEVFTKVWRKQCYSSSLECIEPSVEGYGGADQHHRQRNSGLDISHAQ